MRIIADPSKAREHCRRLRLEEGALALVPTMGALHEGHLELVRTAGRRAGAVAVSIFVNPTQFGPGEDYHKYPRSLDADVERLKQLGGVDVIFAPSVKDLYPNGSLEPGVTVAAPHLTRTLCAPHRPGHFEGVTTVVCKLLNICEPDIAVFGRKDAQQFVILSQMVKDLSFGTELVGVQTVRETDGLALSSRNNYLNTAERRESVVLFEAVKGAEAAILAGELDAKAVVDGMVQRIQRSSLARVQYAEVVDSETLETVSQLKPGKEALAAVAVVYGETRLIDNAFVDVPFRA